MKNFTITKRDGSTAVSADSAGTASRGDEPGVCDENSGTAADSGGECDR